MAICRHVTKRRGYNRKHTERCFFLAYGARRTGSLAFFKYNRYPNDPLSFRFRNLSSGRAIAYQWDFGDESSPAYANDRNVPKHTFPGEDEDGFFLVTLTITMPDGSEHSHSELISVIPIIANFSWTRDGNIVSFVASPTGTAVEYFWEFDDGEVSVEANPVHTFPTEPTDKVYQVKLTVTDAAGFTDSVTLPVSIPTETIPFLTTPRIWENGISAKWEQGEVLRLWETDLAEPDPAPGVVLFESLSMSEFEQLTMVQFETMDY